jgi:hypothetical protein
LSAAIPNLLQSQEFRGAISVEITGPTGAMVTGERVTVTEVNTGTRIPAVPNTRPANTLHCSCCQAGGSAPSGERGVHVGAGHHPAIDIRLEVGDVATSVDVTADASLLNSENSSLGQSITTKKVAELPINGRTPLRASSNTGRGALDRTSRRAARGQTRANGARTVGQPANSE